MPYCHACDKNVDTTGEGCERPGCPVFGSEIAPFVPRYGGFQIGPGPDFIADDDRDCLEAALPVKDRK